MPDRPGWALEPLDTSWEIGAVVIDVCRRAGIDSSSVDIGQLGGGHVDGIDIDPSETAAAAIESLGQVFQFDIASMSGTVCMVARGGDKVATILSDDLVDDGNKRDNVDRKDAISVPNVMHLEYYDFDGGADPTKQTSDRAIDSRAKSEIKVSSAVVMRTIDAARAVNIAHKVAAEEQLGDREINLPNPFIHITDADIITVDGDRYRVVATDIGYTTQKYKLRRDRKSAYTSTVNGVPPPVPVDPPSLIVGKTILNFIDSHIIRDNDDYLGYYIAVCRESGNWPGAIIEISLDGGVSYFNQSEVTIEAIVGETTSVLNTAEKWFPDNRNTVRIETTGDLGSATFREVLNRSNLAIIGDELINFENAAQIDDNEWELSGLLRGRKGSSIVEHPVGTRFVLINRNNLYYVPAELFYLNREITFKVTTSDASESNTVSALFTGKSQTERAPANLQAFRKGSDIIVRWVGVGRVGGSGTVRQGIDFIGYHVLVNGVGYDTTSQTVTVPNPGGSVTIKVAQRNRLTGLGQFSEITL